MSGKVGRVVLWLVALALLVIAWRAQFAFQFADQRILWGWRTFGAEAALFVLWWAVMRGPAPTRPATSLRIEALLALLLLGLGVAFRLIHAATVPPGMNHDAAFNGMYALHILQGAPYTPYVSAAWGRETLFMYLCTPLVAWLGNRPEPIQLAATLVGIATLPIFYLFARALVGPRLALLGLALLAICGWHVLFSRVGWRMIMVPPFAMAALLGLWFGLAGRRWGWILAGAAAAGAIYTYDAGRMVPIMVAVLLGLAALATPQRWRHHLLGALAALITFLIVGAPMLYYAGTHPQQFLGRAANLAGSSDEGVVGNLRTALLMFTYRGNGNDFFVHEPLLEPLLAVLFVLGLLVTLTRWRGGAERFLLGGFALALLPGVLAVPNGNRCITALPFVILFAATGLAALLDLCATLLPGAAARWAAAALALAAIGIGGVETYREFLGPTARRINGFSPEATAAGEYLRGFGERYSRYVIAEDWPEYTLAYLSYNGGGSPLENHYILGRRLEDIEDRINRYGRKGLVFATDLKPAGRAAFERLSRLFAEHRSEEITNARVGGKPVGMALIVEPQNTAHSGLFSDASRVLAVGGDAAATAMRCIPAVGQALGYTVRLQVMRLQGAGAGGEIALLSECPPRLGRAPLALVLAFADSGIEVRGRKTVTLVPAAKLESGRWYELVVALGADGRAAVYVDGGDPQPVPLAAPASRLTGFVISATPGTRLFVDDVAAAPGLLKPSEAQWSPAHQASELNTFEDDFESTPFGALSADNHWRGISGPVSAIASPAGAAPAAAPEAAGDAFDGGHGSAPGQFDQPIGIAVGPGGRLFVADRNNHRIESFARDGGFVRAWGQLGSRIGEFREPHDVAADDEFVYVADLWNQRVQAFDGDGLPMFAITGAPSLSSPRGLAVHDRRIYIAEAAGGRVTVYDRDGKLLTTYGSGGGSELGHLVEPVDVAVAPNGDVWVVNSGNNRLERFSADGHAIGNIPIPGWTGQRLKEVYLAIGADGTLYVGDWDAHAVRRFRPDGTELSPLGDGIKEPSGIALDRDRLLVVSRGDDVVRVVPLGEGK
ncbi:MAG TPA: NHL repeat-containing protein [Candidatus Dormibacteraeota bacterium]|nr:NHL repeat-containing protein [Candidatus Dormibacteraeota bacterium]